MIPSADRSSYVIDSQFRSQLGQNEAFRIIEAGIKFFLYQRGQIPLPYEKLHEPTKSIPNVSADLRGLKLAGSPVLATSHSENSEEEKQQLGHADGVEGWGRLRLMKNQLRTKRMEIRMTTKLNRLVQKEILARVIWDEIFLKLRSVFLSPAEIDVSAIVVMFGPTIFNPKETITFKIDPSLVQTNSENQTETTHSTTGGFPAILREFHRNIIMSNEFLDFTTKPLRSTSTHLCVLTRRTITDENLRGNFILLENFPKGLLERDTPDKCKVISPTKASAFMRRNKSLEVSLQLFESMSKLSKSKPISTTEILLENAKTVCTNTELITVAQCGENSSSRNLFCYQLPMRYRGFSVGRM